MSGLDIGSKSKQVVFDDAALAELSAELTAYKAETTTQILSKLSAEQLRTLIGFADINKNLSQIDATMLTPALLAQIAGTAGVNVTPGALSVLTSMLADLAVTPKKLDPNLQKVII